MPNTLAHLGAQTVLTRSVARSVPIRWVFLGCIVPDLPWIANRAVATLLPAADALVLRPYWIVQASWAGSLLVCGALALLATRPAPVFGVLALNAFLHLLLDGLQTKWGNGVHLWAPWSWETWNAGWFWPESPVTLALSILGLGVGGAALVAARSHPWRPVLPARPRLALAGAALALYLVLPLAFAPAVIEADAHSLETLRDPAHRAGRPVGFDRVWLERTAPGRGRIVVRGGEALEIVGALPERSGTASARGTFRDARTVELRDVHLHAGRMRSVASYLGLAVVAGVWLLPLAAGLRGRRASAPQPRGAAASQRTARVSRAHRSQE